jgi:predicted nuclease with TOPRIM domain
MPKNPKYNALAHRVVKQYGGVNQGNPGIGSLKSGGQAAPARLQNVNNISGGAMNVPLFVSPDHAVASGAKPGFQYNIAIPVFCGEDNQCLETLGSSNADLCGTEGFTGPALLLNTNISVTLGSELYEFGKALVDAADAETQQEALNETLPALEKERDATVTQLKEAQSAVSQTQSELKDAESQQSEIEQQLQDDAQEKASVEEQIAENKSAQEKAGCAEQAEPDAQCADLIKEAVALKQQVAELEDKISEGQAALAVINAQIDSLKKLLEAYEATYNSLQEQLNGVEARLNSRQNAISELKEGAENLIKKAQDIKGCVENYSVDYYNKIGLSEAALEAAMSTVLQTYVTFDQVMQENSEDPKKG